MNIRTSKSKIAFDKLNNLAIIHPNRRDGGIINCMELEDN